MEVGDLLLSSPLRTITLFDQALQLAQNVVYNSLDDDHKTDLVCKAFFMFSVKLEIFILFSVLGGLVNKLYCIVLFLRL